MVAGLVEKFVFQGKKRKIERDMLISNISLQTQHVLDGDGVDLGWSSEQWQNHSC